MGQILQISAAFSSASIMGALARTNVSEGKPPNDWAAISLALSFEPPSPGLWGASVRTAVNDPYAARGVQYYLDWMGLAGAWEILQGMTPVENIIAILNGGITVDHEDLIGRLWTDPKRPGIHGWNAFNGSDDIVDYNGHGTAVAGIAGAEVNNSKGMAGVNPYAQLMAVKVYDLVGDNRFRAAARGLLQAAIRGARVALMPFGVRLDPFKRKDAVKELEDAMRTVTEEFGMIIVSAAGNNGQDVGDVSVAPCVFGSDHTLCVGAAGTPQTLRPRSNYGAKVDVAAPGQDLVATALPSAGRPGDPYRIVPGSGTSGASAIVAGVVSMLLSAGVHHTEIKSLIMRTAGKLAEGSAPINPDGGFVNAYRAMREAAAGGR